MKKISIIGGIGPESTLDYYRGIIDAFNCPSVRDPAGHGQDPPVSGKREDQTAYESARWRCRP